MVVRDPVEVYGRWIDHPATDREWKNGSGYPLASRLVLTAAHVVCADNVPLADIRVRDITGDLAVARVAWIDIHADVALLEVTDLDWVGQSWRQPVRWGRLVTSINNQPCEASGFPAVLASPEARDRHVATGRINPGSRVKAEVYAINLDYPPTPADGHSPWAGMSGAAVTSRGLVVGVAIQDPAGFASGQLVAAPITRALEDARFRKIIDDHCGRVPTLEPAELAEFAERIRPPASPAALLRADTAQTPFRSRPELDQLLAWCANTASLSIRLVYGPGGQGKTRLSRQLAHRMDAQGWATVTLGEHARRDQIDVLRHVRAPTLVIVDYAEGRAEQLAAVIDTLEQADVPARLLLLARTAGSWRTDRVGTSPLLDELADDRILLPLLPLEPTLKGRYEAWREALDTFAVVLPTVQDGDWVHLARMLPRPVLDGERYRTILAVQMDALAQLLDAADPLPQQTGGPEQLVRAHERRYAENLAHSFGITLDHTRLEALTMLLLSGAHPLQTTLTASSKPSFPTLDQTGARVLMAGSAHSTATANATGPDYNPIVWANISSAPLWHPQQNTDL